ncbi:hypothetical protein [Kribbella sp. VKM Ac-2568]|uniref:hypothetical protein n=1 Tax=Kribbella TaxID=182639 RepID=UPI00104F8EDB|nr:hypothetical protein [Kribbella sp. VKM Ac-2568]TCM36203.1 hypothetical protein EV648_12268 [Kribbella sp. VKM Ac-2568]
MAVYTKSEALGVIRRAFGPDIAESVAGRLPDRINPDNATDAELLFELGLSRDRLLDALGGES